MNFEQDLSNEHIFNKEYKLPPDGSQHSRMDTIMDVGVNDFTINSPIKGLAGRNNIFNQNTNNTQKLLNFHQTGDKPSGSFKDVSESKEIIISVKKPSRRKLNSQHMDRSYKEMIKRKR